MWHAGRKNIGNEKSTEEENEGREERGGETGRGRNPKWES